MSQSSSDSAADPCTGVAAVHTVGVLGGGQTALRAGDPVIMLEPKALFASKGEVPTGTDHYVPFGVARIARPGRDITIVATGQMVPRALEAAEVLGVARALVDAVVVAVAVAVADRGAGAGHHVRVLAADRVGLLAREGAVDLGLLRVLLAAVVLAHGQRVAGEADVRLGDRRLLGRAADRLRTVGDRLLQHLPVPVHLAAERLTRAGQPEDRDGRRGHD